MGRGAKIFFISALVASVIFGLISFVIISGIVDRQKASGETPSETEAVYKYDNNLEVI